MPGPPALQGQQPVTEEQGVLGAVPWELVQVPTALMADGRSVLLSALWWHLYLGEGSQPSDQHGEVAGSRLASVDGSPNHACG